MMQYHALILVPGSIYVSMIEDNLRGGSFENKWVKFTLDG